MDTDTGEMENSTGNIYSATDISLILGGIAAAFATIIYSCKHVKSSSCFGFKCNQVVDAESPQLESNPVADEGKNDYGIVEISQLSQSTEI